VAASPAHFLITSWPGGGNVPPALALGQWLMKAGHGVTLAGSAQLAGAARAAGLEFRASPSALPWPDGVAFEDDLAAFDALRNSPALADDLLATIEDVAPSAVIVDCMMGAAFQAARLAGRPTAALVHVLYQPFCELWGPLYSPDIVESLRGVDLRLCLTPAGFDTPCAAAIPTPTYTGPVFDPSTRPTSPADPADPLVLISFGTTTQFQHTVLPRVLDAIAELPVRALLTLGGISVAAELRIPPNVTVADYLPHADVLPEVAAVVCHGGLSTVMASLAHGIPLVCLPIGREQGFNAERVQTCGAGLALPTDATAGDIAKAVAEVLAEPGYRTGAAQLRESIGPDAGGPAAVRALEALAQRI
jgi:UDP:flavonoid glycosyltransferase YjiC (YdhE family)